MIKFLFFAVCTVLALQVTIAQTIKWEYVPGLDTNMIVKAIVIQQQHLFVGRRAAVYSVGPGYCGLYRSDDYGETWQEDTLFRDVNIDALHVHQDTYLIAGCDVIPLKPNNPNKEDGLYRSSDLGATWEMVNRYESSPAFGELGRYVFAGHQYNNSRRSLHGAATWGYGIGDSGNIFFASIDSVILSLNTNYGIGRSLDSGLSWSYRSSTDKAITLYSNGDLLLKSATNEGVYKSTDYGATWNICNSGMVGFNTTGVACFSLHMVDNILYAGTSEGLYYSMNKGEFWQKADDIGLNGKVIQILNSHGGYLYAGTNDGFYRTKIPTNGVNESGFAFLISPNPATDFFTVNCTEGATITVRDVFGRIKTINDKVVAGKATISTEGFTSGIYFVEIHDLNGRRNVSKVAINR